MQKHLEDDAVHARHDDEALALFAVTFEGNMFSETRPVTQKAGYLFNVDQADIIKSIARR